MKFRPDLCQGEDIPLTDSFRPPCLSNQMFGNYSLLEYPLEKVSLDDFLYLTYFLPSFG